jgi:putative selenate reductase FAD-binding subunit
MIIEYERPETLPDALKMLARKQPLSYPLGGGTHLNRDADEQYAVVDLQALGLGSISNSGNLLHVGATTTLQLLLEFSGLPEDLYRTIKLEATNNLRQVATIAGTLVTANGRSPLATLLLALDASLEILALDKEPKEIRLGNWLPLKVRREYGTLISRISFPQNVKVAYESIARTPKDQPIVCASVAQWHSSRTRLALGGWGDSPILALDGPEAEGLEAAARNAYSHAEDEWASDEYRLEMAGILALRCIKRIKSV